LSRPFSSARTPPPPTSSAGTGIKLQREMQDMVSSDAGLQGTQFRQIIALGGESENSRKKVKRVERRLLETEAGDVKVGDVEMLVRELRRVVVALDELGGFEDS
jgi:hypothetical protein